jgi:calcineurin-like phosphoesterase family protein
MKRGEIKFIQPDGSFKIESFFDICGSHHPDLFWSSDLHLWHRKVSIYCKRPFITDHERRTGFVSDESVERMNNTIVERWNALVPPSAIVFLLGDFSLAFRPVELFGSRLNGHIILAWGNHDLCHPIHLAKKAGKHYHTPGEYMKNGFNRVCEKIEMVLPLNGVDTPVEMGHFPYFPAQLPQPPAKPLKYLHLRPKNQGVLRFHGHVHNNWKKMKNQINMGVDVWDFTPVTIPQIEAILDQDIIQDPEWANVHGED